MIEILFGLNVVISSGVLLVVAKVSYQFGALVSRVDGLDKNFSRLLTCPHCKPGVHSHLHGGD